MLPEASKYRARTLPCLALARLLDPGTTARFCNCPFLRLLYNMLNADA